jgi:hypothetical protein
VSPNIDGVLMRERGKDSPNRSPPEVGNLR